MKRLFALIFALIAAVSLSACGTKTVKGTVFDQTDDGMARLDIMPQKLFEIADIGDTVIISSGDFEEEMMLVDSIVTEDGKLQLVYDAEEDSLSICVYNHDFCDMYEVLPNSKLKIEKK